MDDINPESINLFFNYLTVQYTAAVKTQKWWKDDTYAKSDNKSFFERYPFTIDRDKAYSQPDLDLLPDEYKRDDNAHFRGSGYATGVDSHFAVNTNTSENITFGYDYEGTLPKITAISSPNVPEKVYIDTKRIVTGAQIDQLPDSRCSQTSQKN